MNTKLSRLFALVILLICLDGHAQAISDDELLEVTKKTFTNVKAAKTKTDCIQAIRDSMGHLNDAEKTRAMALTVFDFDEKDGRMRHNAIDRVLYLFDYDPSFIADSSELKRMMANETDARKFFVLASMADRLIDSQKADFVVEMSPMLFRHEPMAKMSVDSEYYFRSLSDASFFAYSMIVKNLQSLDADFAPPDEKTPYPEKIEILVKWLNANWPGCGNLGMSESGVHGAAVRAVSSPANSFHRNPSFPERQPAIETIEAEISKWPLIIASVVLLIAVGTWLKVRNSRLGGV